MGEPVRIGKRGTVVIPATLRRRFGLNEGSLALLDESEDGVVIRPAVALPIETYTKERRAAFLLENAVDAADYSAAVREVQRMGLDPSRISHRRPKR